MKIIKPLTLGLLNRPYRYRGQDRLAIAALGFFGLGSGPSDRFLIDNLQWAKLVPTLPVGLPLDHILPKARAELMLSGVAHAIGEPVKAMTVRMQCGAIDKRLTVIGEREWRRVVGPYVCVDEAKPFRSMPLTWENAWGGIGCAANPLGRGYLPRRGWFKRESGKMPNVEVPGIALRPGRKAHAPACLAPMNLLHSPLRVQSGTYDQRWLEEDFPGLPRDFDFGMFNLAAPDQQFSGRFKGDEAYCLEGVHRVHARLQGSLPGLAARAFVLRQGQGAAEAQEVPLACDTVWFFPELDLGMLVYRGETPIVDSDALDVSSIMLAYERVTEAPRSLAHYREVMALRLDRRTAGLHAFNESQLAPPRTAEAVAARAAARARLLAAQLALRQQLLDERMVEFWQKSSIVPPESYVAPKLGLPALQGPSPEELAEGDFDLAELNAQALALADAAKRDGDARLAAGQATLNAALATQLPDSAVAPLALAKLAPSVEELTRKALEQAAVVAHDLVTDAARQPDPVPVALREALDKAELAQPGSITAAQHADIKVALAQAPALRRAARNAAIMPTTLHESLPDATALALGEYVLQCLRDGVSLAGRDLAGACLREADLRGADLREVQLERADLRGANLSGASLQKAILTAARLDGADFSKACLDGANLCGTQAVNTSFRGASLRAVHSMQADWSGADLQAAQLQDWLAVGMVLTAARLDDTQLERAVLNGVQAEASFWRNTQWLSVVATGAGFAEADFTGATLERCVLMDAVLKHSRWHEARLTSVYAGGKTEWEGASLRGARFSRCGLHGARMAGVDLQQGVFAQTDFGEADLSDASLSGARFYRSLFMQTRLRRVQARGADFFQALCRKADFSQAALADSIFVQADAAEAIWNGADLGGASVPQKARLS